MGVVLGFVVVAVVLVVLSQFVVDVVVAGVGVVVVIGFVLVVLDTVVAVVVNSRHSIRLETKSCRIS